MPPAELRENATLGKARNGSFGTRKDRLPSPEAFFLVAAIILFLAEPAHAQWVFSLYTGPNATRPSWMVLDVPEEQTLLRLDRVGWEARAFSRPLYYGVRAAWFPAAFGPTELGPELEFIHAKVYLKADRQSHGEGILKGTPVGGNMPISDVVQDFNISHGLNLLFFNLAMRHGFAPSLESPQGRLLVTGRLGYGFNISHFESIVLGHPYHEQYAFGGSALQISGGLEVPLWRRLYGMTEYKLTRTRPQGPVSGGGETQVHLRTHHLVFGVAFHL